MAKTLRLLVVLARPRVARRRRDLAHAAYGCGAGAATVADLSVVHPGVRVNAAERRGVLAAAAGAQVETDPEGRARLRLDDGTTAIVDRATDLKVDDDKLELRSHGRMFVLGAPDAKAEVKIGEATRARQAAPTSASSAATGRPGLRGKRRDRRHGGGRRAEGARRRVGPHRRCEHHASLPEKAFDDWTGGLAAPWGANGTPRRAVGELWGRDVSTRSPAIRGSPLTIRSHDVDATVTSEVAETRVKTTYFNGGSQTVTAISAWRCRRARSCRGSPGAPARISTRSEIALAASRDEASSRPRGGAGVGRRGLGARHLPAHRQRAARSPWWSSTWSG